MAEDPIESLTLVREVRKLLAGHGSGGVPFRYPMEYKETPYLKFGQLYASGAYKGVPHPGVDFTGPEGSMVMAAGDGVVTWINYNEGGYGNYVVIKHNLIEGQAWTLYAHLYRSIVEVGNAVKAGTVIGTQGHTGNAGGVDHLHFEVKRTAALSQYAGLNYATLFERFYEPYTFIDTARFVR